MKNKKIIIVITVLSMICLQATVTAFAVELPFVPVDESETVTTAASDNDTPIVTEKQTSATVTAQKPTTTSTKKSETTKSEEKTTTTKKSVSSTDSASPNETPEMISDSKNNALPVISPDGEVVEELGTTVSAENEPSEVEKSTKTAENSSMPENSDISFSDDKNSSDMHTEKQSDSNTSEKSYLPIVISVICGAIVIAGAVLFAIFKKGKK